VAGRNTPQKLVWRARIVLMWAEGTGTPAEEVRSLLGNLARGARVEERIAEARELAGKDTS
jgi:hypothetical protein